LLFTVRPKGTGIGLMANGSPVLMNPEQAAQFIVKPMCDWIRGRSDSLY
jgi:hypothetical protein